MKEHEYTYVVTGEKHMRIVGVCNGCTEGKKVSICGIRGARKQMVPTRLLWYLVLLRSAVISS